MSFSTGKTLVSRLTFTAPVNNNFMKVDQKEQNQKKNRKCIHTQRQMTRASSAGEGTTSNL